MDDDDRPPVCLCGRLTKLIWSPVFSAWCCPECLWQLTERHLKEPVTPLPVQP